MRDGQTHRLGRSWRPAAQSIILASCLVILGILIATSYWLLTKSRSNAELLAHALQVEASLTGLHTLVQRAESRQLGYVLTGSSDDLAGFTRAADAIVPALSDLKATTADDPRHREALAAAEPALSLLLAEWREAVRLHDTGDQRAAIDRVQNGPGRALAQRVREALEGATRAERQFVERRTADSERTDFWLVAARRIGIAIIIVLVIVSILMVRQANREREVALRSLETANARLEATIAERTAEIRRTVEVLDNTITGMAAAVVVVDPDTKVVLSNPFASRLLGMSVGMMFAEWSKVHQVFLADEVTPLPVEQRTFARALRGEPVDNMEIFLRRTDAASGYHLLANSRPLRDAEGAITGAVVVYHDVTETRQIEHQLHQAQKLETIGQLTGGVAHDFNNILTVITGTIDILARAVSHDPMLASIAKMIDDAANRGAELTRRLVAFARKQPLQPRPTDINALVVESAKLLRPTLGEQIEIESMLEDDAWPALVDPSQLAAALINLALNARDAMPGGGRLTLETGNVYLDRSCTGTNLDIRPGPYVMIAVSDTGAGIPVAIRERVFEPFFTTKEVGKGTGLGLSMVYGFVKQSGGHIKIYSEEGHGTAVKLYLPRADEHMAMLDETVPIAPPEGGDETILVVEDDPLVRAFAIAQLNSLGYATLPAENAIAALAIVDQGIHADLLFTDIVMPGGLNGRELAERVLARRPATRILFTSGYSENAIMHHGRLDAGVLLLAKPYRKADLARMIRVALGARKAATPIGAG